MWIHHGLAFREYLKELPAVYSGRLPCVDIISMPVHLGNSTHPADALGVLRKEMKDFFQGLGDGELSAGRVIILHGLVPEKQGAFFGDMVGGNFG